MVGKNETTHLDACLGDCLYGANVAVEGGAIVAVEGGGVKWCNWSEAMVNAMVKVFVWLSRHRWETSSFFVVRLGLLMPLAIISNCGIACFQSITFK